MACTVPGTSTVICNLLHRYATVRYRTVCRLHRGYKRYAYGFTEKRVTGCIKVNPYTRQHQVKKNPKNMIFATVRCEDYLSCGGRVFEYEYEGIETEWKSLEQLSTRESRQIPYFWLRSLFC